MALQSKNKKTSHSIDQTTLKVVCDLLCDNIEDLFNYFGIEYRNNGKFYSMCCPVHGGDNPSALNIYHIGDSYRGNWKCRTHQCEKIFKGSIIGFIRGLLSHRDKNWTQNGDDSVSFGQTLEFIKEFSKIDPNKISVSRVERDKQAFVSNTNILNQKQNKIANTIRRETIQKALNIPSPYFLKRGFSPEVLIKYDVGECATEGKEMFNRSVAPIYDINHEYMIGCTGRVTNDEIKPKWKHSEGFRAEECLYNFWYAKEHIQKSKVVIVVESPGNVWRLEESGIHNSVALFGSNLNDKQKMLLDMSGAMKIITIMDNDTAGEKAREQITKKCEKIYNIDHIYITSNDVAEMTIQQIKETILPRIIL